MSSAVDGAHWREVGSLVLDRNTVMDSMTGVALRSRDLRVVVECEGSVRGESTVSVVLMPADIRRETPSPTPWSGSWPPSSESVASAVICFRQPGVRAARLEAKPGEFEVIVNKGYGYAVHVTLEERD